MSKTLEKAFEKAFALPEKEKEAFGEFILNELESEKKWDSLIKSSSSILVSLAEEAKNEYKSGKTKELDFKKP
tara:strand:+ start:521 stop:739 length:219 start_codon:yes stop_codon:yes gene_type:complete